MSVLSEVYVVGHDDVKTQMSCSMLFTSAWVDLHPLCGTQPLSILVLFPFYSIGSLHSAVLLCEHTMCSLPRLFTTCGVWASCNIENIVIVQMCIHISHTYNAVCSCDVHDHNYVVYISACMPLDCNSCLYSHYTIKYYKNYYEIVL